ncbi:hypothetical protein [Erwinia sp. ErVv1]|nr:hypothetical protein [Erwinia sp. ErVv1]
MNQPDVLHPGESAASLLLFSPRLPRIITLNPDAESGLVACLSPAGEVA